MLRLFVISWFVLLFATPIYAGDLLQYHKIDEIPEGPGLFSRGNENGLVLFSKTYSSDQKPTVTSVNENMESNPPIPTDGEQYQEFLNRQWEQFQEWKKRHSSN